MRRREFITFLGGVATAWPLTARAQQSAIPVIGFLSTRSPDESAHLLAAFRNGLAETGVVEGQSVVIEFRWARGEYNQLPALAAELVRIPVTVLVAIGGEPSARAAKVAATMLPVVTVFSSDPVKSGLVASLSQRGAISLVSAI